MQVQTNISGKDRHVPVMGWQYILKNKVYFVELFTGLISLSPTSELSRGLKKIAVLFFCTLKMKL